jgi:hypothetical protein
MRISQDGLAKCDCCGKEVKCNKKRTGKYNFPYEHNWIFLFITSFKIASNTFVGKRDKGFCSPECAGSFFILKLREAQTGEIPDEDKI